MGKYVLVYTGGAMEQDEAAQQESMNRWMGWFGSLGEAVVDGGAPFGPSATVGPDGAVSAGGGSSLTGYTIISADDLDDAGNKAKGCPVLTSGGSVEIYEAMPIG